MANSRIEIAPHLSILIADRDRVISKRISNILKIIGFYDIELISDPYQCLKITSNKALDIVFVDMDPTYETFWGNSNRVQGVIIGMTYDKNARTWMSAIRRGADSILLKQYHPQLLRPMLAQLVLSPRAWRGRLVQFPNTPSMRTLARSTDGQATDQLSSFGENG